AAQRDNALRAGIRTATATELIQMHLRALVRRRPERFLGADQSHRIYNRVNQERAALATSLGHNQINAPKLRLLLGKLLEHKVPLIDPALVFETIMLNQPSAQSVEQLVAGVRHDLGGFAVDRVTSGAGIVQSYEFDPMLESSLVAEICNKPPRTIARQIAEIIGQSAPPHPDPDSLVVVACSATNRYFFQQHLSINRPDVVVISTEELDNTQQLDPLAVITSVE
ncbi:MAG: FHIPEP family type III secretion protein, partial [Planctomycetota bacterium]